MMSYSTCPGLGIKWTGRRLVTDSGTKCTRLIHESKAVQIHVHNNRRCLRVPRVPGSVKHLGPVVPSIVSLTSSLTHLYRVDSPTLVLWTGPFPINECLVRFLLLLLLLLPCSRNSSF